MLRKVTILLFCRAGYLAYAHQHCHYDMREVDLESDLTFCSMDFAPSSICCTETEDEALKETFNEAGDLTAECADYYKQLLCGICGSYSGHLYERLTDDLGTDNGLTMKNEFCTGLCDGQIDISGYEGADFCTVHTGGGEDDLFWSYPYELSR